MKKASLLWLIAHKAVWTRARVARIGRGDGFCPRCKTCTEDLNHFFFDCSANLKYFNFLRNCFKGIKYFRLSEREVLLGECFHLDVLLWHNLRGSLLFCIWKERNAALFRGDSSSHVFAFMTEAFSIAVQIRSQTREALTINQNLGEIMQNTRWQTWQSKLAKYYSPIRFHMIEGIMAATPPHL